MDLALGMPVERIAAHPNIRHDSGMVALQRGPIVYCLEEVDNGAELSNLAIPRGAALRAEVDSALLGGAGIITGEAVRSQPANWSGGLYQPQRVLRYDDHPVTFRAIPYSLWANRQPGEMRVWLREA